MSTPASRATWYWPRTVLLILAILCFLLAVFRTAVPVDLVPLGLALGFGAFLFYPYP